MTNRITNLSSPEFLDELWNAICDTAASSGRKAKRIVLFGKNDLKNALDLILKNHSLPKSESQPLSKEE